MDSSEKDVAETDLATLKIKIKSKFKSLLRSDY